MRNAKEFIDKVTKKMQYSPSEYTVIDDSNVYEELKEDIINALDIGMVFIEGTCIPDSPANQLAKECNSITWDNGNGISIIVPSDHYLTEGINIQPLGVINTFLNELIKLKVEPILLQDTINEEDEETKEHISLKDYYRLNLPENRIGRKSDATLIKELEEAGFGV